MRVLCGAIYIKFRSVLIKTTRPGPSHGDVIFVGVLAVPERGFRGLSSPAFGGLATRDCPEDLQAVHRRCVHRSVSETALRRPTPVLQLGAKAL